MLKLFPAVAASAVLSCSLAAGQTIHKCTLDGKLSYGDQPCTSGALASELRVATPAPDMETMARMARQIALAQQLTARDDAREQRDHLAAERALRSAAAQQRKCARLRLRQRWAVEDAGSAAGKAGAAASVKARRQAQVLALECPS